MWVLVIGILVLAITWGIIFTVSHAIQNLPPLTAFFHAAFGIGTIITVMMISRAGSPG